MAPRSLARGASCLAIALATGTLLLGAQQPPARAATTWYVSPSGDDSADCASPPTACRHIGAAIGKAAFGDTINIAAGTYMERLSIGGDLTLVGAGARTTVIDGGAGGAVVGVQNARVSIAGVTVRNGLADAGGGVYVGASGSLAVVDSAIAANTAGEGGGIYNLGQLSLTNSLVGGNTAAVGGGLANDGTLALVNSTVGFNGGGGIANRNALTLANATIGGNSGRGPVPGGILNLGGTVTLQNTILAGNAGSDCRGVLISNGYNLLGSNAHCQGLADGVNGDRVGTGDAPLDPGLGPLQDNGGPTDTMALLAGSPAVDDGNPSGCTDTQGGALSTDQRGYARPYPAGGRCDVGAFEYGASANAIAPTPTNTAGAGLGAPSTPTALDPTTTPTAAPPPVRGGGPSSALLTPRPTPNATARPSRRHTLPPAPFGRDTVFAGVGAGLIDRYSPTGRLLGVLNTHSQSTEEKGMCFDRQGNLYVTNFDDGSMSRLDSRGRLLTYRWGGHFDREPESCTTDARGHVYVGEVHGRDLLREFTTSGRLLRTFRPAKEFEGIDWIDLASDQCTLYYTSEGGSVKRFDVCHNRQLPDFARGLAAPCYAVRVRPNGEVLVACSSRVYRLDRHGRALRTYTTRALGEHSTFAALSLDPDNASFWTAGFESGRMYRIAIATGRRLTVFSTHPYQLLGGIAVSGEIAVPHRSVTARAHPHRSTPKGS